MRPDLDTGAKFPDYELLDHTGTPRRLSELQGEDPMVIVLAREAYSAKDQRQHEGLVQLWKEMKPGVGYCRMVTITTTDPQETLNYRSGVAAEWPFLSDPARVVQRDLDIPEYTDQAHNQMVPHTVVCETRSDHLQDLQWLLVLRAAHCGGTPPRPPRRAHETPRAVDCSSRCEPAARNHRPAAMPRSSPPGMSRSPRSTLFTNAPWLATSLPAGAQGSSPRSSRYRCCCPCRSVSDSAPSPRRSDPIMPCLQAAGSARRNEGACRR